MVIPETGYPAIKLIARFPRGVPLAAMLLTILVALLLSGGIVTPAIACVTALLALLAGGIARLAVELVIVMADTLLPR